MATKKQKRKKHFARKHHQDKTSTGVRLKSYINGAGETVQIELPRGGKDVGSHSKKGGLDARGLALRDLREIGINNPEVPTIREYQRLVKRCDGDRRRAKMELQRNLDQVLKQVQERVEKLSDVVNSQGFVKLDVLHTGKTSSTVDVPDESELYVDTEGRYADVDGPDMPTSQQWDELVAEAKKRKRGIRRTAEKAGWKLTDDELDGKSREDWVIL